MAQKEEEAGEGQEGGGDRRTDPSSLFEPFLLLHEKEDLYVSMTCIMTC
jgi:hypothetical protein